MPNWEPNWKDVEWDEAAAHNAELALKATADLLEQSINRRRQYMLAAIENWRGGHRREFDVRFERIVQKSREHANLLRETAWRINRANVRAKEEQQRRIQERKRWEEEKADEERLLWNQKS